MDKIGMVYAWLRVALGATSLVAPRHVGKAFGIGEDSPAAARHIGARDLVMGIGVVMGERHGAARGWHEACAAVDLLDAGIAAGAGFAGAMPKKRAAAVVVLASGSAAVGLALARQSDHSGQRSEVHA